MTSVAQDSRAYRSATAGLARMAIWALGNRPRIARSAGRHITASPTQFVARTRIFENSTALLHCDCNCVRGDSANTENHRYGVAAWRSVRDLNCHLIQTHVTSREAPEPHPRIP